MTDEKYTITHMGKTFKTKHWINISEKECKKIREKYLEKPSNKQVDGQLRKLVDGGKIISHIKNYYFKDLMAKVRLHSARWSIEEMLQCDDLIRYYYSRIMSNKKVYPPRKGIHANFASAIRISGGRIAMNPSNFPIKTIDYILGKYNVNGKYYDFSCGWGVRMLSSLRNKVDYFGTDPNNLLVDRLHQLAKDYDKVNQCSSITDIRCAGSEIFVPEWKSTFGCIFSSPPYYILEDYKVGNQSVYLPPGNGKDGKEDGLKSYQKWIETYVEPTVKNCVEYLVDGGYFAINMKNTLSLPMYDDIYGILSNNRQLEFVCEEKLQNIRRPSIKKDINTDEKIMVFQKKFINLL